MLIDITHSTRFSYGRDVVESAMEARLEPRNDPHQRRASFALSVQPHTRVLSFEDGFSNLVHCFSVLHPHDTLEVTARSRVETRLSNPFTPPARAVPAPGPVDVWPYLQFGGLVLTTPEVQALATRFMPMSGDLALSALCDLMHYIYEHFDYEPEATDVTSTVADALRLGKGVCQDLAHVMIATCRAMGIPARYVSGYIASVPHQTTRGDGASHAWCEAWVPVYGWRGFDPTNDLLAADLHVKVGHGRSYQDVPPTRGVYRGTAEQRIDVRVSTVVVDGESSG
jgi:transglutaminase-like putative cysteine protease